MVYVQQDTKKDSFYVDGRNWCRHLNSHGPNQTPNLQLELNDLQVQVWTVPDADIKKGDELLLNYGFCLKSFKQVLTTACCTIWSHY